MKRKKDWRASLVAYVASVSKAEFKPGRHDCALFAAGAVEAMTGEDLAAKWRGKYRSLKRGQVLLQKSGFADHIELAASHFDEVPPLMAQVGDIAVIEASGEDALGVVQGSYVWAALTGGGLGLVPLTMVKRAFRV